MTITCIDRVSEGYKLVDKEDLDKLLRIPYSFEEIKKFLRSLTELKDRWWLNIVVENNMIAGVDQYINLDEYVDNLLFILSYNYNNTSATNLERLFNSVIGENNYNRFYVEDEYIIYIDLFEKYIKGNIITEDGDNIITKDGDNIVFAEKGLSVTSIEKFLKLYIPFEMDLKIRIV
jgi:hypothetical protein